MNASPPFNVLRLSFDSHAAYRDYLEANRAALTQVWLWHQTLGDRPQAVEFPGICDNCHCQTRFTAATQSCASSERFKHGVSWWSSTLCDCGLSNLERAALRVFLEGHRPEHEVYHVGHHSLFRSRLSGRLPGLTSSQYEEERSPGEVQDGIRYEDLTRLSFESARFDTTFCMEILEHIPDYREALRELARITRPCGRAILTVPWLGSDIYENLVRAELRADGSIHHFLPPEYHGDPASHEGILSFRSFGWQILDDLRECGFSSSSAEFVFGPVHGYMELLNPVVVAVR